VVLPKFSGKYHSTGNKNLTCTLGGPWKAGNGLSLHLLGTAKNKSAQSCGALVWVIV